MLAFCEEHTPLLSSIASTSFKACEASLGRFVKINDAVIDIGRSGAEGCSGTSVSSTGVAMVVPWCRKVQNPDR